MARLVVLVVLLVPVLLLPARGFAQRYEGWSPITMAPYGPLTSTGDLPEWIEVAGHARTTEVVFAPERRVRWTLTHGPHGVTHKRIEVDGELWADVTFRYVAGRVATKEVRGPVGTATYRFSHDAQGRIRRRARVGGTEQVRWRWGRDVVRETWVGSTRVRRERWSRTGELRSLELGSRAQLRFRRRAGLQVERRIARRGWERARPSHRFGLPAESTLEALRGVPMTRTEVRWLFGLPNVARDDGTGSTRRLLDDYSDDCTLNHLSGFRYGPTGLVANVDAMCICGFCAALGNGTPIVGAGVPNVDRHATRGPFVRIGDVLLTPEHRVLTPFGLIPANALRSGELVLTRKGAMAAVISREPASMRLTFNVRTDSGLFDAGGLWLASETDGHCVRAGELR